MEWKKGTAYFFKLDDGSILTGTIVGFDTFGKNNIIKIIDKYNNPVGFREDKIIKYSKLTTKVNKVNNLS